MRRLVVSVAVRPLYESLGVKGLNTTGCPLPRVRFLVNTEAENTIQRMS